MIFKKLIWKLALVAMFCVMVGMAQATVVAPQIAVNYDGSNVHLYWDAVPGATSYYIYKSDNVNIDFGFPYDVSTTNTYMDTAPLGNREFYAVTTIVPVGTLSGTVTDTNSVGVPGVWVSGKLESDTTVTFAVKTLAGGTYATPELVAGTWHVFIYKQYRPVADYSVVITDGGAAVQNHQWAPFAWVPVEGHLTGDVYWTNDNVYQMTAYVWVDSAARLFIERGTTFVGTDNPSPLLNNFGMIVVRPGAQAFITGEKYLPVVGCSARPVGQRRSGDWGGISVMGHAHNNRSNGAGTFPVVANGEGNAGPAGRPDALFDTESSGVFRYLRLEHSGFRFNDVNELNGIAWYCVGSGTHAEYIESTCSKDDQMEFFGGTVSVSHVVCHSTGDDGFDWTDGWNGSAQFVVVQNRGVESDHCIEADNYENGYDFMPRSNPRLANFTLIHSKGTTLGTGASGNAMVLRRGTLANIHNFIVMNGYSSGFNFDDSSSAWQATQDVDGNYWTRTLNGATKFDNSMFWNNGQAATEGIDATTGAGIGDGHFLVQESEWDETNCRPTRKMCVNSTHLAAPVGWTQDIANFRGCGFTGSNATTVIANPNLINPLAVNDATGYNPRPNIGSPCLNPANAAPALALPAGIQYVPYVGAFSGPTDNWMEGWTAFPDYYEN
jgi:hypothetical protein